MENSEAYQLAKKRVKAKIGFYSHFAAYVAVISFLAIINLVTSPGTIWVHWPLLGWGIAVALHAFAVFVVPDRLTVTDHMIQEEMGKSHPRT